MRGELGYSGINRSMKVGIMQPYFLPYIGYWQLLSVVDIFVILDDVNYIKRGFINRNSILLDGRPYRFSIPVKDASQNRLIMNTKLCFDDREKERFLSRIGYAYGKTTQFSQVYPIIDDIVNNDEVNLTEFIQYSLIAIARYLGITTEIVKSSVLDKDNSLTGQDRIIEICRHLKADTYINPTGGRHLYDEASFNKEKMELFFLDTKHEKIVYPQFDNTFVGMLSIVDIMMFNPVETIQEFLKEYDLNK